MFVLCPRCEFLVGADPRTGQPLPQCPKCGQALENAWAVEDIAPAPAPELPSPEPPPLVASPQSRADAVIAAMAAKPARKPRAKSRTDAQKRAPAPPGEKTRRKRVTSTPPTPAASPISKPPGPSLAQRFALWFHSRKPGTPADPTPPHSPGIERRKALVHPVPSLRERAAQRAAAAAEAQQTPPPAPLPDIAPHPIGELVAEPSVALDVTVAQDIAAPAIETPDVATPIVETPVEPPVAQPIEPPPVLLRPRAPIAPSFLRTRTAATRSALARWPRAAAIAGLSLLLALQLLLAQRDVLAADARWRPTIAAACTVLRCTLPAWRQPDAFTMLSRDVRPHPQASGTLQIDASFRNDARWAQPWPLLVVRLSDIDGRIAGARTFTAREYLGTVPTQDALAVGQTAAVRLAVVEPAPDIVAFTFEFR